MVEGRREKPSAQAMMDSEGEGWVEYLVFRTVHHVYTWFVDPEKRKEMEMDVLWMTVEAILAENGVKMMRFIIYTKPGDGEGLCDEIYLYMLVDKYDIKLEKKQYDLQLPAGGLYESAETAINFIDRLILNDYDYTTNFSKTYLKEVCQLNNGKSVGAVKRKIKEDKKRFKERLEEFLSKGERFLSGLNNIYCWDA